MKQFLLSVEDRINRDSWVRRIMATIIIWLTIKNTDWAMHFANLALEAKADLTGTAATIAAVSAVPIGFLTLLLNKYIELRNQTLKDADLSIKSDSPS